MVLSVVLYYGVTCVQVKVKSRTEYSYTTFYTMEVPGPGEFARATRPLEASIKITPTAVVTNSLPYYMEGYLLTVAPPGRDPDIATSAPVGVAPVVSMAPGTSDGAVSVGGAMSPLPTLGMDVSRKLGGRLQLPLRRSEVASGKVLESDRDRIIAEMQQLVHMLKGPKVGDPPAGFKTPNSCMLGGPPVAYGS
mgnify:CR=1 FL=1